MRGLEINRSNQVWASDVTYIPMQTDFVYLTVIVGCYSRKVLSCRISNSLDARFCIEGPQARRSYWDDAPLER